MTISYIHPFKVGDVIRHIGGRVESTVEFAGWIDDKPMVQTEYGLRWANQYELVERKQPEVVEKQ